MIDETQYEYAGFWLRFGTFVIDSILVIVLTIPLLKLVYGDAYSVLGGGPGGPADIFISWVLPALAVIAFWVARGATPGKMALAIRVVDEHTGAKPSVGQSLIRYLGYYVAMLPLGLGLLWVGWDPRKQGWHDKMARTVVIRPKAAGTQAVRFERASKETSL